MKIAKRRKSYYRNYTIENSISFFNFLTMCAAPQANKTESTKVSIFFEIDPREKICFLTNDTTDTSLRKINIIIGENGVSHPYFLRVSDHYHKFE